MFSCNYYKTGKTLKDASIPFCIAVKNISFLQRVVKKSGIPKIEHDVMLATHDNRLDILRILIENKWEPSERALMIAIEKGLVEIIQFLIESRLEEYICFSENRIKHNVNAKKSLNYFRNVHRALGM